MIPLNLLGITVLCTLINEDFNNYYDWGNYQIKYDILKNRLKGLRSSFGYSSEIVQLLERMLAVEEYDRIPINEVCQVLSNAKCGGDMSFRESSVNSIEEEYRDYYGDFDNEMVQTYRENQQNQQHFNSSPVSHGTSHHSGPAKNYRSTGIRAPEPFQELTQKEARQNLAERKRKSATVNNYGQNYSPQVFNPDKRLKKTGSNSKFDIRNFEFNKQKTPGVSRSQRHESNSNQRAEYGYYPENQNENQNIPSNFEEPKSLLNPGMNHNSSKNLLSGGYRLSNVNMGPRLSQVRPDLLS